MVDAGVCFCGHGHAVLDNRPLFLGKEAFGHQQDGLSARQLAEASPGFVWRLQGDNGNATEILTTADPYFLINMSVWKSIEAEQRPARE